MNNLEENPLKKQKCLDDDDDKKKCSGCYPKFQPNQLAHMEPGGCLSDDPYPYTQPHIKKQIINPINQSDKELFPLRKSISESPVPKIDKKTNISIQ